MVPVVTLGPDFLAGRCDADAMANTMLAAVRNYVEAAKAVEPPGPSVTEGSSEDIAEAEQLGAALREIHTCGSGYLADRCDADCVARTMTQIMAEFGALRR